jgi:hypothetical protein
VRAAQTRHVPARGALALLSKADPVRIGFRHIRIDIVAIGSP